MKFVYLVTTFNVISGESHEVVAFSTLDKAKDFHDKKKESQVNYSYKYLIEPIVVDAEKFGPNGAYGGWEIRVLPTADEIAIIQHLLDLVRQVDHALDDSEEVYSDGFRSHNIAGQDFDDVVEALDALEDLPDDRPGMTLGPAGKAEWALRRLLQPST